MKDYRRWLWLGILSCLSGMLTACGGGGGGGGNSVPAGSFTLSTTSVSFSAKHLGPTPAVQTVLVHLTGSGIATVGAGYANGVTAPSWLTVSYTGTAPDFTFTLTVNSTALTSGSYSTTLTFGTADANNNILQTQPVQISYSLKDGVTTDMTSVSTSLTVGDSFVSESLPFTVNSPSTIQWTAQSDSPWLTGPAGTQQGGGNTFSLAINMAGLGAGTYTGKITLINKADPTDTASFNVIITMAAPTLTVTPSSIVLGGASGLDVAAQTLTFSINTNKNAYAWTATATTSSGGSWLNLSASSGTVSGSNSTLTVNASRNQLAAGTYTGQIQLQTTVNGSVVTQSIPVKLNVDPNRLIVNATGIAFSSFPSRAVLTRTLKVANTWGVTGVGLQAAFDQPWLTGTANSITNELVLTANPSGLAPGQYTAHVTITSPDTGVSNQETVRVGLTVGSTDPAALITLPSVSATVVTTSPVEPVAFVTAGQAGAPIYVYDLDTGTLLNTFTSGFTNPGGLAISGDGLTLYVADNTASGWVIRALNAATGALQVSYPFPTTLATQASSPQLAYARPDTRPVLLCPFAGEAFDLVSGATYPINNSLGGVLAVSPDQTTLYQMSTGISPAQTNASSIVYSTLPGVGLITTQVAQNLNNGVSSVVLSDGQDIAVSADGTAVYTASGAPYDFEVFNTSLVRQSPLAGDANPDSIATSWNGLVAAGAAAALNSAGDIWIYDSKGNLLTQMTSDTTKGNHALAARTLRFSGDGTRLTSMGLKGAGLEIHATPVPPP